MCSYLPGTESVLAGASYPASGICEIPSGANVFEIPENFGPISERITSGGFSRCKIRCKGVQTGVNVQTTEPGAGSGAYAAGGSSIGATPVEADTPTGVSIWCLPGRHRVDDDEREN